MTAFSLTGAVMAGGASRRMGRDKATLLLASEPLWQRQVRLLRELGASPVGVVRRPGQPALDLDATTPLWLDTIADIGPLAGLHAALSHCPAEFLAVVATDMPRLDARWFEWLLAACDPGCGAVAQHPDGRYEPLAAVYPRAALASVARLAQQGPCALQTLLQDLREQHLMQALPLSPARAAHAISWNTPADYTAP